MKDTYTKEEVIKLLVEERQRAIDIIDSFSKRYGSRINIVEICRLIKNTIDGITGLTPDDETIEDRVKESLENPKEKIKSQK